MTPQECRHQELFGVHFSELLNTSCDKDFQQRWVRWGDGRVGQSDCFLLTNKVRDIVKKTLVNDFTFFTVLFSTYTFVYIYIFIHVDDVIDARGCHRYVIQSEINAGQWNLGGNLV